MSERLICPQGHQFERKLRDGETEATCPECGSRCSISQPDSSVTEMPAESSRPRGLWGLMQPGPPVDDQRVADAEPRDIADEQPLSETNGTEEPSTARQGLWALMGNTVENARTPSETVQQPSAESATETKTDAAVTPDEKPAAKSLWSVMRANPTAEPSPTTGLPATTRTAPSEFRAVEIGDLESSHGEPSADAEVEPLDDDLEVAPLEEIADISATPDLPSQHPKQAQPELPTTEPQFVPQRSRGAVRSAVLGGIAVLASGLALQPEFYAKIPATLFGFLALMVGLLSMGEIRRSRGRQIGKHWAGCGIGLGVLGMLLGPIVFSRLGAELRNRYGRRQTYNNLGKVGEALEAYEHDKGHFPSGSLHTRNKAGEDVALHNWTTQLLPYLGKNEAAMYAKINLKLPYDHKDNRRIMGKNVEVFLASGASREKTQSGFGVTHFAALGGTLDVENVGRVNVGIFGRNSQVKRNEVTDGLEQTLVTGEIAFEFPAWGQPGHYRAIGKGLNKARDGFGNADRTGAMFLRADGSVKFLSNKIAPEILRKLSTRDGREKVELDDY